MKLSLVLSMLLLASSGITAFAQSKSHSNLDSLFKVHFNVLDSSVLTKPKKRYYCCTSSIYFMESYTGVISSSEQTYLGKLSFNSEDLLKWHKWYVSNSTLINKKSAEKTGVESPTSP